MSWMPSDAAGRIYKDRVSSSGTSSSDIGGQLVDLHQFHVKRTFEKLAARWEISTRSMSFPEEMFADAYYRTIVGMGRVVVPLMIADLVAAPNSPRHWFVALREITGADPVRPEDRGLIAAMAESWINWARENGRYSWSSV